MSEEQAKDDKLAEARILAVGLIERGLQPDQAARLEQLVCENVEARRIYVKYIHQRIVFGRLSRPVEAWQVPEGMDAAAESMHDTMVVPAIQPGEVEKLTPAQRPPPLWQDVQKKKPPANPQAGSARRSSAWAALIAIFFLSLTTILLTRPHPHTVATAPLPPASQPVMIATLIRTVNAMWRESPPPNIGSQFPSQTALQLTSGYAEFTLASGTDIVVQAPAGIVIQSNNSVGLQSGKLAARVPPPAIGFSVSTSQSTITDLGTEFGVNESSSGTEVDVFKGKVTAQTPSTRPTLLVANDEATVSKGNQLTLDPGGAVPQRFVRQLQTDATFLDAVDLVSGGDGTTARRGPAIDPNSGNYGQLPSVGPVTSLPGYHRVALAVIDGCFVPNAGSTQVDSAGHQFVFKGARGSTFNHIGTGNKNDWPSNYAKLDVSSLGGIDYSIAPHGYLFLHANSGLTFDLAAIDALHPDCRLTGFRCIIGNAAPMNHVGNPTTMLTNAFVIIDGVARYQRLGFTNKDSPDEVTVPIGPSDRFLTLVSSHNGASVELAWVLFADPKFTLSK